MDPTSGTALGIERRGAVTILENRDPPHNPMTFEYTDELERAVIALRSDRGTRALVITAAGDEHFSVGMDLKQLTSGAAARGGFEAILDQRLRVLTMIEQLDKPVIATMFGYCLGGGLELPLACHFRFAATEGAENLPLEDALRVERDAVRRCSSSADQIEGMRAFLEKRPPQVEGR